MEFREVGPGLEADGNRFGPAPYVMLYLLLLAIFVSSSIPRAHADTCGTTPHDYAGGLDGDTYSDYGTAASQTIHSLTICGTSSNQSAMAVLVMDNWANGDWLSNGYFSGEKGDGTGWVATLDYYWDETISGHYYFSDISSGTSHHPSVSQSISFTLQGSLNTGTHAWTDSITHTNDYTINISGFTMSADYASSGSETELESHTNLNTGAGDVSSLQNLKYVSPNFTWTSWASGVANYGYPYCAYQLPYSHYTMDTSTTGSC